jgi:hypothetical protein
MSSFVISRVFGRRAVVSSARVGRKSHVRTPPPFLAVEERTDRPSRCMPEALPADAMTRSSGAHSHLPLRRPSPKYADTGAHVHLPVKRPSAGKDEAATLLVESVEYENCEEDDEAATPGGRVVPSPGRVAPSSCWWAALKWMMRVVALCATVVLLALPYVVVAGGLDRAAPSPPPPVDMVGPQRSPVGAAANSTLKTARRQRGAATHAKRQVAPSEAKRQAPKSGGRTTRRRRR